MKCYAVFIEIETLKFRNLISCKPSNVGIIHLKSCVLRLENLCTPWYDHMQNCNLFWTHSVVNQVIMSFTGNNRVGFPLTKDWQVNDYIPLGCLGHAKNGYSYRHSLRLLWPCDSLHVKAAVHHVTLAKKWQLCAFLVVHALCMGLFPHDQVQLQKYHAYCSEQLLQCASDRRVTWKLRDMYI